MNNSSPKNKKSSSIIARLVRTYLRPYFGQMAVAFVFMFMAAAATASFAKLLQPVLDQVLIAVKDDPERVSRVWRLGGYIMMTFVVSGISTYIYTIKMNKISQSIVADIQSDVFSHFMKMDLSFFHSYPSGQLVSRITNDVNVMRSAVSDSLTGIGKSLLTLILLIGVMVYQDAKLALLTLVIFPVVAGVVALIGRRLRKLSHSIQSETANLMSTLIAIFQGIRQVQAFGMEEFEKKRSGVAIDNVKNLNIKAVRIGALSTPLNEIMVGMVLFGIIFYGAHAIAAGHQTAGGLMSFIAAFSLAYEPMKKLAKLNNALQLGVGAAERVLMLLDLDPKIKNKDNATTVEYRDPPEIVFKNVSFKYEGGGDDKAVDSINIEIKAGQVTAFVGESGSGKTTLLNLIPRFYDVNDGEVLVNGANVNNLDLKSFRKQIALVSQDITIFDDSVTANIAYGSHGASDEDIVNAAKMAAADDFISEMSDKYDTVLGENGVKLSGGQRQRISIARAILRDAPILLLDEATSALDNKSESSIKKSIKALEKGKTTVIIAHRLSSVQNADKIVVLNKGRVVEEGNHTSLLKKEGVYSRLYNQTMS